MLSTNTFLHLGWHLTIVVCLPKPIEGMGRLQFSDLITELPVPPQTAEVVGTFYCLKKKIIMSTAVSVLDLKDAILFLQGLFFCVRTFPNFLPLLSMCVMYFTSFDGFL